MKKMILIRLLLEKQLNYDRKAQDDDPALFIIYETDLPNKRY